MKYFAIDENQLRALKRVMNRLHSEDRLNGDAMRDLGHTIEAVVHVVEQLEIVEDK